LSIDVTVATLNNESTIDRCLRAIREHLPVENLIVVDGGSTDRTLELARAQQARLIYEPGLLGRVRFIQARECTTEWIAYVDSDVFVYQQWWPEVSQYVSDLSVGMVSGFVDLELGKLPEYDAFLKYKARKFGVEAFSNTLIRRGLVLECEDKLRNVHAGEDSVVARHVVARGYRIITIPKRLCFHDRKIIETHPQAYFRSGQSIRQSSGAKGIYRIANSVRRAFCDWRAFSIDTGNFSPKLLAYLGKLYAWMIIGFLSDSSALKQAKRS